MRIFDLETLNVIASISTACGVIVAAYQIRISRIKGVQQFEDGFAKEYRDIANRLPPEALLGLDINDLNKEKFFDDFYRYFDLCNEQIFLRNNGRITKSTWIFWRDGIRSNMRKPAFAEAWNKIEKTGTKEFSELRKLQNSNYKDDPLKWS
jgi:hypothetical protein